MNLDGTAHEVELQIERSGETVFQTTETVSAEGPQPVLDAEDGVPTERGEYTVAASLADGSDDISRTFPDSKDGDCCAVTVQIDADGSFRGMPTDASSNRC